MAGFCTRRAAPAAARPGPPSESARSGFLLELGASVGGVVAEGDPAAKQPVVLQMEMCWQALGQR